MLTVRPVRCFVGPAKCHHSSTMSLDCMPLNCIYCKMHWSLVVSKISLTKILEVEMMHFATYLQPTDSSYPFSSRWTRSASVWGHLVPLLQSHRHVVYDRHIVCTHQNKQTNVRTRSCQNIDCGRKQTTGF